MHYSYSTNGVCASQIDFDLEDNKVSNIAFTGGCNGNLKAISKLCQGQNVDFVIDTLIGNTCGFKKTSCADQFALALKDAKTRQE